MWQLFLLLVVLGSVIVLFLRQFVDPPGDPAPPNPPSVSLSSPPSPSSFSPSSTSPAEPPVADGGQLEEIGAVEIETLVPLGSDGSYSGLPVEASAPKLEDVFEETTYFAERHFSLEAGETVVGILRELDRGNFNLYVLDSENYQKFSAGEEYHSHSSWISTRRLEISFTAPSSGKWYFVFELNRKLHPRVINLELKKQEKESVGELGESVDGSRDR
jgi:hypothetical protein